MKTKFLWIILCGLLIAVISSGWTIVLRVAVCAVAATILASCAIKIGGIIRGKRAEAEAQD